MKVQLTCFEEVTVDNIFETCENLVFLLFGPFRSTRWLGFTSSTVYSPKYFLAYFFPGNRLAFLILCTITWSPCWNSDLKLKNNDSVIYVQEVTTVEPLDSRHAGNREGTSWFPDFRSSFVWKKYFRTFQGSPIPEVPLYLEYNHISKTW